MSSELTIDELLSSHFKPWEFSQERQGHRLSRLRGLLHQWQRALTLAARRQARRQARAKHAAQRRHAELRRREKEELGPAGRGKVGWCSMVYTAQFFAGQVQSVEIELVYH